MSRFGIIYVAYQCEDLIDASLFPWVEARAARLGGYDYVICAVSVPFVGFEQEEKKDGTLGKLEQAAVDCIIASQEPLAEVDARGRALKWLRDEGKVTHLFQVDSDEIYEISQILNIVKAIESNPFIAWWRIPFKNYVFDDKTYLVEPFRPPRIHEVRLGQCVASGFWDDNNVMYKTQDGIEMKDTQWAGFAIPTNLVWIKHLTWLSDERSRRKVAYQRARWGHCSFRWDDEKGRLCLDEDYYRTHGLPPPEVAQDPS
jgi:hypothetical protein